MDGQSTNVKISRRAAVYICAFLFPALLMVLILWTMDIYPNGPTTLLIYDMQGQYVAFFASLKEIFEDGNTLFFNWNRSMGGNYLGIFAYYMASPLSFLTLFFDTAHMPDAIYLLTVLKIGLCGLSFALFLDFGLAKEKGSPVIVLFSVCYALMSYNMMYSMCLMWMDGVIFLPLVLLGIEQMIGGKKGFLYFVSIWGIFICNYYISYMVGVFAALYLLYRILTHVDRGNVKYMGKLLVKFGINTLLALGLAMPLLLPALKDLLIGKLALTEATAYVPDGYFNFYFPEVLKKLFSTQYDTIYNNGALPSIFCGTITVLLVIVFFVRKGSSVREKIGSALLLGFLLVSFWLVPLDKALHGFQIPNCFPYRYAFCFSALMLILAYRATQDVALNTFTKKMVTAILCVFTVLELALNGSYMLKSLNVENNYMSRERYELYVGITDEMIGQIVAEDDGLYRIDKSYQITYNDGMLFGYKSLACFSSSFNQLVNEFFDRLGLAQWSIITMGYGSTELTDGLLGVKYRLTISKSYLGYEEVTESKNGKAFKNKHALPLAYLADANCMDAEISWQSNPFENQNIFLNLLTGGEEDVFAAVECRWQEMENGWEFDFEAMSDNPVYMNLNGGVIQDALDDKADELGVSVTVDQYPATVYVNGEEIGSYFTPSTTCNLCLGTFEEGERVKVEVLYELETVFYDGYIYELDVQKLWQKLSQLEEGGLHVNREGNAVLSGTVTAGEDQVLFTSIPYEEGLQVTVDGEEAALHSFDGVFLVIPLTPGTHEICVSYTSPGVVQGGWIGIAFLCLSIGRFGNSRRNITKNNKNIAFSE